jgi:hypothetical protein
MQNINDRASTTMMNTIVFNLESTAISLEDGSMMYLISEGRSGSRGGGRPFSR